MLILITGGSGSGKSACAEQMVLEQGVAKRYYIATMRPWDEECREKIARHRQMRADKEFHTIECYENLVRTEVETESVVLLECMSNLAANEYYGCGCNQQEALERIITGIRYLQNRARTLMIVTNEVFSDGMIYEEETRDYMELLGRVNRKLAEMAQQVFEVVYGIPVRIK